MVAVVAAVLRGPLSSNEGVAKAGLVAMCTLAINDDNKRLLGAAGACDGEGVASFVSC